MKWKSAELHFLQEKGAEDTYKGNRDEIGPDL